MLPPHTTTHNNDKVVAVSRRLLKLRSLLGGQQSAVDVVWMLTREPRLLTCDYGAVTRRLVEMKVAAAAAGGGVDVLHAVEAQPALLLAAATIAAGGGGGSSSGGENGGGGGATTAEELTQAWAYGLASDGDDQWSGSFSALLAYAARHGDTHVGARDGDDPSLARWANKQRSDKRAGTLIDRRVASLAAAGFEFEAEAADWMRWYHELAARQRAGRDADGAPAAGAGASSLSSSNDFLLSNWCSVQRIARRSGVLIDERVELLTGIGFDWDSPDALS